MNKKIQVMFVLALILAACTPKAVSQPATAVEDSPAEEPPPATSTISPFIVTTTADSGLGSFRQALQDARYGDVIQFDPAVFPPDNPATIYLESELPHLNVGNVTLDARTAGVILDGSGITGDWVAGLQIVGSSDNIIQGLVIRGFPGPAILFSGNCTGNLIAGNQLIENERGVDMEWAEAVGNTITGNLIGTDADGLALLGNLGMGILVGESATDNIIGPDNVIAYNGADGLYVHPAVVEENETFSNSLFGNTYSNQLVVTEEILVPPAILDFNFAAGQASGAACPNCRVRLFSTETGREFGYEGETTADADGVFSFSKGSAFDGPAVMTQAITPNGRFSTFSEPLEGEAYELVLQRDNMAPRLQLPQKHSRDLTDNRIAAQFDALGLQQPIYDLEIYPMGITRARIAVDGIEPQQIIWDLPEFTIHPLHEAVINRMVDNGLVITYVLMFWDKETYPNGEGAPCYRFQTEEEIDRFLDYVRFVVDHFRGRVQYYEIWNEPDIAEFCPKSIDLEDYANLVQRTVPVIRETDPDVKIVIGGVSNTRFGGYDYLVALLENPEIMPLVDVISFHPQYGASPEYAEYVEYYENYPLMVEKIKKMAESNGFKGEYHADELTYRTKENAMEDQPWTYSTIASNKYFLRSVVMHLGMDVDVGLGMPYFVTPRLCTVMNEAQPAKLNYLIENTEGADVRAYAFSMPGDTYLLGLWTEGIVNDFNPGIEGSLHIKGIEVQRITVIDMLHGVEQELPVEYDKEGNLFIEGLMMKDYPLMIKLWDAQFE
jgi:hypothetical protein